MVHFLADVVQYVAVVALADVDTMLHLGTNCCRLVAICSRCGTDVAAYAADAMLVI